MFKVISAHSDHQKPAGHVLSHVHITPLTDLLTWYTSVTDGRQTGADYRAATGR